MNFATPYFTRYKALPPFFSDQPDEHLAIIFVIPCYDDAFIFETLASLNKASRIVSKFEVIVVVNSGEKTPVEIVKRNRAIYKQLQHQSEEAYYKNFRLLPVLVEGTVKKKAGVGFARKTGMDEAVIRFDAVNNPEGLIVSLDADTLVAANYLQVMESAYNREETCFTFQFQHHFDKERYSDKEIRACKLYEMYLRYYRLALKTLNVPFSIHTIGSCFAIRAGAYIKSGGMPVRQAGEDFYFLQKAVKMIPVCELKEPVVYPSPRISERVPFGTGASIRNIIADGNYYVCNFGLFGLLKTFYELFPVMEHADMQDSIPAEIIEFIGITVLNQILAECRKYSSSSRTFLKRMYDKFDAFFIVKFLNDAGHKTAYPPVDVTAAATALLLYYDKIPGHDLYEQMLLLDRTI
ncbi:MAG: glycosyltransferase [Tannerella sp.]|jgi:glycosyltransferase involved in cell wall biosynthesis|nr:glycosyltransferase [Tannerella sp.]